MVFPSHNCFAEPEPEPEYLESIEGYEEYLQAFLAGRNLIDQRLVHEEQKKEHDEKYLKEVYYDARDNGKGKGPFYKKYREDHVNKESKCDAQYINNLQIYYGDGSKLKPSAKKQHYAVDFINPHGVDTDATAKLKSLEVVRKKKTVLNWIRKWRNQGFMVTPLRRSVSSIELPVDIPPRTHIEKPRERFSVDEFESMYNLDTDYESFFNDLSKNFPRFDMASIYKNVAITAKFMIAHVNAKNHTVGTMGVSKVLFSRENMYSYVIPAKCDTQKLLRGFSARFKAWLAPHTDEFKTTFGTDKDRRRDNSRTYLKPYYFRVNVILNLKEFDEEGTQFRRARHVCSLGRTHDLYLELDTGMLRMVMTTVDNVRRMPQQFAIIPTPILEVRFDGVQNQQDVSKRIEEIRETGITYIARFDEGNRVEQQTQHYEGKEEKEEKWINLETAVLVRLKKYKKPGLTSLFCEDVNCMGLCCTEELLRKAEVSTPTVSTPSPWVADKDKGKTNFEKKFKYPSTTSYLQPANLTAFFKN